MLNFRHLDACVRMFLKIFANLRKIPDIRFQNLFKILRFAKTI